MKDTEAERFFSFVSYSQDGCWEWLGTNEKAGYGWFYDRTKKRSIRAHRWSYEYFCEPPGLFFVCHHCDNPICVNPFHLYAGTVKDNTRDCIERGRHNNKNKEKTLCLRGHPLEGENLLWIRNGTGRQCRECKNQHNIAYRKRRILREKYL